MVHLDKMKNLLRVVMIVIACASAITSYSKEIKVKSFSMQMEPMTVPMQRKDNNGNICALVKVIIPDSKAVFEGSLIGNCDYKTSEYWCYLTPGSKLLKIKYPNYNPLLVDFESLIGGGLKSSMIYELVISLPDSNTEELEFSIKGEINKEKPNESGIKYGEKIPYTPGYTLYKNYYNGKHEGIWKIDNNEYSVSGIHIGDKLTVIANDDRYEPQTIEIKQEDIGNSDFNFFLIKKKVSLNGYLVDQDTGEPVVGAEVSADDKTWFKVDDYGYFTIDDLVIDNCYILRCRNTPYGYLTYEKPKVIPLCSSTYGWGLKRNSISAWIELNGINPAKIKAWCDDGHEVPVDQGYDTNMCYIRHPLHHQKPRLIIKCEGYKTIMIDFESYLATPKPVKFKKGNENEIIHYRTIHKGNGKHILEQVK